MQGALAGCFAGLAGTLAMYGVQRLLQGSGRQPRAVNELSMRGGRQDVSSLRRAARRSSRRQQDATVRAASALVDLAGGPSLTPQQKHHAGLAAHYAFGAATGALYGAAAERSSLVKAGYGAAFGLAVWILAAEVALPLLRLTRGPKAYAPRDHLNAAVSHAVFGLTAERVRRTLRAAG